MGMVNARWKASGLRPWNLGRSVGALLALRLLPILALAQPVYAQSQQVCQPTITLDAPAENATLRDPAVATGWAADLADSSGSGIDAVHIYLDGEAGGTGVGLGEATTGLPRPDVAAAYGQARERSGWSFPIDLRTASLGGHALYVYAHTRCGWSWARRGVNVAPETGWALMNPPEARNSHAAVWDPADGQMLVVGGRGGGALADLWTYRPANDTWTPLDGPNAGLIGHTAVWDPIDSQMIVYGGLRGKEEDQGSSLWSYKPTTRTWSQLHPTGDRPRPRAYHSAVWDSSSGRMLIFGGIGGRFEAFNDVWSYDPRADAWADLSPQGFVPEERFFQSAVWDQDDELMLVFAGANPVDGLMNDLWGFSPALDAWVPIDPTGPSPTPRLSQSAVWDPIRSQMLVFAGGCGGCYLDDLWSYSPADNTWSLIPMGAVAPARRGGHSAVWDAADGEMLVFGGSALNDLWAYRPATATWNQRVSRVVPAPAMAEQASVWDSARGRMLLFGGKDGRGDLTPFNGIWSYTPATNVWEYITVSGPAPTPRSGHTVAWDDVKGRALLFGGAGRDGKPLADLWIYDTAHNAWSELSPTGQAPSARAAHAAVWDAADGRMFVFGGMTDNTSYLDDLWSYDPSANAWGRVDEGAPSPDARARHAAVWDPAGRRMLVFGGYRGLSGYSNELWSFSPSSESWTRIDGTGGQPPARARHGAVWDSKQGQMLIFGGYVGGVDYLDDLWSFQPSTGLWTRLSADSGPGPRGDGTALWDTASGSLLVFGGHGGDVSSDLWSYRPSAPRAAPAATEGDRAPA
ncbi:MAG TPA: kelch repeat-containing protein [Chloroflexota bacterium]|nr:kelch repeat-containing protein [Chloroflexota bacterium]